MPASPLLFVSCADYCDYLEALAEEERTADLVERIDQVKTLINSGYNYQRLWRKLDVEGRQKLYYFFIKDFSGLAKHGGGLGALLKCFDEIQQTILVNQLSNNIADITGLVRTGSDVVMILESIDAKQHGKFFNALKDKITDFRWTYSSLGSLFKAINEVYFWDICDRFAGKLKAIAKDYQALWKLMSFIRKTKLPVFLEIFRDELIEIAPDLSQWAFDFKRLPSRRVVHICQELSRVNTAKLDLSLEHFANIFNQLKRARHKTIFYAAFKSKLLALIHNSRDFQQLPGFLNINELQDIARTLINDASLELTLDDKKSIKKAAGRCNFQIYCDKTGLEKPFLDLQIALLSDNPAIIKQKLDFVLKEISKPAAANSWFHFFKCNNKSDTIKLVRDLSELSKPLRVKINHALFPNAGEEDYSSQALLSLLKTYVQEASYQRALPTAAVDTSARLAILPLPAMPALSMHQRQSGPFH